MSTHKKTLFTPFLGLSAIYLGLILVIVALFNYYNPNSAAIINHLNLFDLLVRWDSVHYLNLASQGYTAPSVLFPLYSLIIAGLSFFMSGVTAGFVLSFISLSVALHYFYLLLRQTNNEKVSGRALVLLLFFPTAMFLPLIYTESLFLALLIAFFYYLQRKAWLTAAILGALAVLTRNVGIFLWPVYLVYIYGHYYSTEKRFLKLFFADFFKKIIHIFKTKEFLYSLLIPFALILFCGFLYFRFHDPLAFVSGQKGWNSWRTFMWPWQTLAKFFTMILITPIAKTGLYNFIRIIFFEGGSFLLLLIASIYWTVKKNWAYSSFSWFNTLLFSCMFPMLAVNRYVLVVFPIFIFLAQITKHRDWLFYSLLVFSLIGFIFNVYLFTLGAWVG